MANLFTDTPEKEPISFYKGETIVWKRTDIGADYAPSRYSIKLSYHFSLFWYCSSSTEAPFGA